MSDRDYQLCNHECNGCPTCDPGLRRDGITADFAPELGQMMFTNTPWHDVETPGYITDGLHVIAAAIQQARGIDPDDWRPLTGNGGAEPWEGDVFAMRTYCWCDGERAGHEDGCPPNFEHKTTGFSATWYKHANRGGSCSTPIPTPIEWGSIIAECIAEVAA